MACAKATHKSTSFASLKKKQTTLLFSLPQPAFQLAEKQKEDWFDGAALLASSNINNLSFVFEAGWKAKREKTKEKK
eukprot:UN20594